jgi:hypothetical protein
VQFFQIKEAFAGGGLKTVSLCPVLSVLTINRTGCVADNQGKASLTLSIAAASSREGDVLKFGENHWNAFFELVNSGATHLTSSYSPPGRQILMAR